MEFSILTTIGLLLVAVFSYDHIVALFESFTADSPLIEKSWRDLFFNKSLTVKKIISDAHAKYSKNGKVFRLGRGEYVLPPSLLEQSRKLPTSVLDSSMANEESLHLTASLAHDYWDVINFTRQYVTRSMQFLVPSAQEQITRSFTDHFPPKDAPSVVKDGKTYSSVTLHPTLLNMVGMIGTKIMFGKKYSRNKTFTDLAGVYANGVAIQAVLMNKLLPSLLKAPVKKYVLPYLSNARRAREVRAYISDDILSFRDLDESELDARNANSDDDFNILPMMVKYVQKQQEYKNASVEVFLDGVAGRTLGLLFAAVDTTTLTSTQIIFDLVGHPKAQYADPIMEEVRKVSDAQGGKWTNNSLGELRLLDSFIKESQRLHSIGVSLGSRLVMPREGFTFQPDRPGATPLHFPQGSVVMTPLAGVHYDPDVYPSPTEFQGFRFAKDAVPSSQPSDKFMAFGHGRHACPGRHLALNVLKLMIIEFLENYEWIEIPRPADMEFATSCLPDMKQDIQIRRKTTA